MGLLPAGMILAAGLGSRLKPLSDLRPKPLMEVSGYEIIYYLINNLIKSGIKDIYINVYYKAEQIIKAVKAMKLEANIIFSVEEKILGTAGGVRRVVKKFGVCERELVVINGDIWCDLPIKPLLGTKNFTTLVCAQNRVVEGYVGSVAADEHEHINELGRFFNNNRPSVCRGFFTGVHILSSDAIKELLKSDHRCLVSEVYPHWLSQKKIIKAHMAELNYEDLGSITRLLSTNLKRGSFIHPEAFVQAGVSIGPNVIVGARARLNKGAQIKNSVIMSDTVIEKDEHLDCIIALLNARVYVKDIGPIAI